MPDDGDKDEAGKPVSMDDLKALETTLKSSMDAQMLAMREYITELMAPKAPPVIPITEDTDPLLAGKASGSPSSKRPEEGEDLDKNKDSSASSLKGDDGKREYHEEKWRSPDPPIPHPHINNRGDPPKLDVSDFVKWQFEFNSHV